MHNAHRVALAIAARTGYRAAVAGGRGDAKRQASEDLIVAFVTPLLDSDEGIVAVVAAACGPLPPFTPLIPLFGVIAMFTRWLGVFALVATNQRLLLVRRAKVWPGLPQNIDLAEPWESVAVSSGRDGSRYGKLRIEIGGEARRLCVPHPLIATFRP